MRQTLPNLLSYSRLVVTFIIFALILINQPWAFLTATVLISQPLLYWADRHMHLGQMRRIWLYKRVVEPEYTTMRRSQPRVEHLVTAWEGIEGSKTVRTQMAYAKAQLVDRTALREAQEAGDVLGAYRVLQTAYETDVRPLLAELRSRQGRNPDPIAAFRASGYAERVARERTAIATTSGYPGA